MIADGLDFFIAAGAGKFPSYLCEPQQIVIQTVSKSEGMETIHTARNKKGEFLLDSYGKESHHGNNLHIQRKRPGSMTSSNSSVVRSSQAKISQHNSRRYYQ
jgi:hypothetical protein